VAVVCANAGAARHMNTIDRIFNGLSSWDLLPTNAVV
jgi:hypothetical protein